MILNGTLKWYRRDACLTQTGEWASGRKLTNAGSQPVIDSRQFYDGSKVIEETNPSGLLNKRNYWGADVTLIRQDRDTDNNPALVDVINWVLHNADGSTIALADNGGVIRNRFTYDQDGQVRLLTSDYQNAPDESGMKINSLYHGNRWMELNPKFGGVRLGMYEMGSSLYDAFSGRTVTPDLSAYSRNAHPYDPGMSGGVYGNLAIAAGVTLFVTGGFALPFMTWGGAFAVGAYAGGAVLGGGSRYADGQSVGQSVRGGIYDTIGFSGLYAARYNQDIVTGESLGMGVGGRAFAGAMGGVAVAADCWSSWSSWWINNQVRAFE